MDGRGYSNARCVRLCSTSRTLSWGVMSKPTSTSNSSRKSRKNASYLSCGSAYGCSWTYALRNGQQTAEGCGERSVTYRMMSTCLAASSA